jgi:hypothetical protein
MPRRPKADADLRVVPLQAYTRPDPPADLEPELAAVWRLTTSTMRPEWFHAATFPLLRNYCRSVVVGEKLAALLSEKMASGPLKVDEELDHLLKLVDAQSRQTTALARSLRVTPRSRRDPVDTRWQDRKRPWEG